MRALHSAAVFGLVPVPCVGAFATTSNRRGTLSWWTRTTVAAQFEHPRNDIRERLATRDELAEIGIELNQIERQPSARLIPAT